MSKFSGWTICCVCLLFPLLARAVDDSFVVATEKNDKEVSGSKEGGSDVETIPKIYEMQIDSNVSNRFARTLITSKVRNLNSAAQEATFSVILPDKAFISEFVMIVGGKSYKAYVKEKEEAKNIYQQAVSSGVGAAHVAVSARESNRFTVSLNIEAQSKATFLLTYEELLKRKEDKYELIINIHPKQPVKDLFVNVLIDESRSLKFVKTPSLRSGNEITKGEGDLDPRADINRINSTAALVKFRPNIERQKELAANLGTDVNEGLSGQFVVQYDVERDPNGGEVLVQDGYFVHFFAPSEIKPLNKFIIFVLDTSGSMYGQKMPQLKEAMKAILDQLDVKDYFHIVGFESNIKVWDINNPSNSTQIRTNYGWQYREQDSVDLTDYSFPNAFSGSADNIKDAKEVMLELNAQGGTNIYTALKVALNLIELEKNRGAHENLPQPIIMFLTDGDPTVGVTSRDRIVNDITSFNKAKAPIYCLSFGNDADKTFLKKLSQKNNGFSRHIYEASDAALQLRNFYKEIASPLLSDVKFEYVPDIISSLTKTQFPIHFGGSEIVVSGKINAPAFPELPKIICRGWSGPVLYRPIVEKPVTSLERLWAYLTVRQLLDDRETAENKTVNEKKALDLALKYSFVTPVSSLVVVKPNSTDSSVDTEAADKVRQRSFASTQITFSAPPLSYVPRLGGFPRIGGYSFGGRHALRFGGGGYSSSNRMAISARKPMPESISSSKNLIVGGVDDADSVDGGSVQQSTDDLVSLKSKLPWLSGILNEDGTLKSPVGGYKLGLNETLASAEDCPLTPTNTTGHCKLLHACPQVHTLLTAVEVFVKYFCPISHGFAGICCP